MERLLLLCALTMTACAPIAQLAQPGEAARLTQDGLSLLVSNPGPDSLTGDPSRQTPGGVLTVDGVGLVPDDQAKQWCTLNSSARWDCPLPRSPISLPACTPPIRASWMIYPVLRSAPPWRITWAATRRREQLLGRPGLWS
jgi:hypothetical protein